MERRTDEELITSLQAGDTGSLGLLVARWEQPLFRFVFRHLPRREEAQDICQETFLRVLRKSHHFRKSGRFSTWMYQIALNLCRDHARKKTRWRGLLQEGDVEDRPASSAARIELDTQDPTVKIERLEARDAVVNAMDRIPAEQREVLILKEFEGLKFREIAELLDCPESTVKSRMYYGLRSLRSALSREGIGPA